MALAFVPRMSMWRRFCLLRRALASQYRKSTRDTITDNETIAQKSSKNRGVVTTFSEKNSETAARLKVESDAAFSASSTSTPFVDCLFDSYSWDEENIMWLRNKASAKIKQLDSFTRMDRNCASGTLFCAEAMQNVVMPKH